MDTRHPRRWFQLSRKSVFLLTLIVAVFCGGYSLGERNAEREASRREKVREQLRELGLKFHNHHDIAAIAVSANGPVKSDSGPSSRGGNASHVFSFYVSMMR